MHFVTAVRYLRDYKLLVTFDDGAAKVVDLEAHLEGEVFEPLKDKRRFRKVFLNRDTDTIAWDNNADISPDFLYEIGTAPALAQKRHRLDLRPDARAVGVPIQR